MAPLIEHQSELGQAVDLGTKPAAVAETQHDTARLAQLMLGYQRADGEAVAELIARLSPVLLRYLAGPVQTRPFVEDMLQDCWLRIHRARHTYRPGTPVLPWVFAIARYTRIDTYRRRRRIDDREMAVEEPRNLGAAPESAADASDLDLWKLVAQLPSKQQDVLRMMKVFGMSLEEVARATGSSAGAVKQKSHRAYEKLRQLLEKQSRAEGGAA